MGFEPISFLVLLALSVGVSYLLRAKQPESNLAPGEITNLPTCEQGTPYKVIFGRPARFKSVMVLWHGAQSSYHWEDGDGANGYYYYLALHLGLSHANIDGVKQIWFDDRCFWPTYNDPDTYQTDGETSIIIAQSDAWGGKHNRGGVNATGTILYGSSTQTQNTTLKTYQDGDNTPYYRGITSIVFDAGSYWGTTSSYPLTDIVLKRTDLHHDGTAMWYIAKANVDDYDSLNIVHVIRECLTSTIFGRGVSTSRIDSTTFEAAADTLYTEGIGISYGYSPKDDSMSKFLKQLEQIMDGIIYFDHSAGKYKIRLIRDDYDEGALTVYDEDDFSIAAYSRSSYYNLPSETIVMYTDIGSSRKAPAKSDDLSIMQLQGETPVSQTFDYPMITNPDTAVYIATREQDQVSRNPAYIQLVANRTMYDIQRGDVFKISHPRLTKVGITTMVVRAVSIDRGLLDDGNLTINVVEEVFKEVSAGTSNPSGETTDLNGRVTASIALISTTNENY